MMNMQKHLKNEMTLIYDKECPMCNHFACRVENSDNQIRLLNGREDTDLLRQATGNNLDIDKGIIVFSNDRFFYGPDAIVLLASDVEITGIVGFFSRYLLRNRVISRILYPFLVLIRQILLRLNGMPLIRHKREDVRSLREYNTGTLPPGKPGNS
jgi:predicted DCC family thiol-disulfide oxidoreductase YuxK